VPNTALVDGMAIVGEDFRDSIPYVPDALRAVKAVKMVIDARVEEGVRAPTRARPWPSTGPW